MWHIVLFSKRNINLKGSFGPATVPVKSLNSNQCPGGLILPLSCVVRALIVESCPICHEGWATRRILRCCEGRMVESDPPYWCLTFLRPDGVDGLNLFLIVGYVIVTTDGIAEDSFLDCMARVRAYLAGATVEYDVTFVTGIDRPETEP